MRGRLCAWGKSWHLWGWSTPPEVMTARARWYLAVAALQNLALAAACLLAPETFAGASFTVAKSVMPLTVWGVAFLVVGVLCVVGLAAARRTWAFLGLAGSGTAALMWLMSYLVAWATGTLSGPVGPIVWAALVARDYIVCGQPMRSPLDPIVREVLERDADGGRE